MANRWQNGGCLGTRIGGPSGHRSVGLPGLRIGDQPGDPARQAAGRHLGHGRLLEHQAEARSDGHPDLLEVLRRALVLGGLRPKTPHLGEGAVEGPDHLRQADLFGRPGEAVAAFGPALARHDAATTELSQDRP